MTETDHSEMTPPAAFRGLAPLGGSAWEQDLYAHLAGHAQAERAMLDEYAAAAATTESKALAYLINLLITDEVRHHQLFDELAASLKVMAELSSDDPVVPSMDFRRFDRTAVLEVTERLLKREREDAKELKRLHRELKDVEDTTLWSLLVDVMRRDTDKHIAILDFVKKHA
jgi:hypothetical protein